MQRCHPPPAPCTARPPPAAPARSRASPRGTEWSSNVSGGCWCSLG